MRCLPRLRMCRSLSAALLLLAVGCRGQGTEREDQAGQLSSDPPGDTVFLSLVDGSIVVQPDSLDLRRNERVHWTSTSDPDASWIVAFGSDTPFRMGQRPKYVFNGPSAGAQPEDVTGQAWQSAPLGVRKYTVFWPDTNNVGDYIKLDPKLVIQEAAPDTTKVEP